MTNVARIHRARKFRRAILQPRRFQWVDHRTHRRIRLARKASSIGWTFQWNPPDLALTPHLDFETARLYRDALVFLAGIKITPIRFVEFPSTFWTRGGAVAVSKPTPEPKRRGRKPCNPLPATDRPRPDLSFTLDDLGELGYYPGCTRRRGLMMSYGHWMAPCKGQCVPCLRYNFRLDNFRLEHAVPSWGAPAYRYGNLTTREVERHFSDHTARTGDVFVVAELRKSGRYEVITEPKPALRSPAWCWAARAR